MCWLRTFLKMLWKKVWIVVSNESSVYIKPTMVDLDILETVMRVIYSVDPQHCGEGNVRQFALGILFFNSVVWLLKFYTDCKMYLNFLME